MWKAIFILPFNAAVTIPVCLLALTGWPGAAPMASWRFWIAAAIGVAGLALFAATVRLFHKVGQGTLAPWDPPKRFVVEGPYRFFRHPMIVGVSMVILAEALAFNASAIAFWLIIFVASNMIYLPLREEPDLVNRFGDSYRDYMDHVPRWRPRITPWRPEVEAK